ncbi:hypothetical protein DPMN_092258 [Dreissena polymorpha]|uniref:Uncharacterized protein n=1 Tax=Dreissena polymorpha TaxID=45954 RepID=A0A9D4QZZ9_DREPO|nr:hypothetical protein DPMN_092258 [Dreissena polymorpha]
MPPKTSRDLLQKPHHQRGGPKQNHVQLPCTFALGSITKPDDYNEIMFVFAPTASCSTKI